MELALNIAWLVLSAGLVVLSSLPESATFPAKRHRVALAIALACLIAFLFPIISMTDDLNSGAILAETAKSKRWAFSAAMFVFIATGLLAAFSAERSTWGGRILSESARLPQELFSFHCSRRPPPAIS